MIKTKKYYEVIAKCGHVGKKHYVPVKFAVIAENGKEAAKMVRDFPRVKHNHKDAILKVSKISYERFEELTEINRNDPYLKCHSRQEQKLIDNFEERLKDDLHGQKVKYDKEARLDRVAYKIKKTKILKKFSREDSDYVYAY